MPYTGDDPYGPFDPGGLPYTGPGLDPSYYYAVSPGGRFPGDTENAMEYENAQARGTAGNNPAYNLPDFLTRLPGALGAFFRSHESNVQRGGEGQSPDFPGGYGYHFFSGPAADYGPPGGPLHGLVDMGRPEIWDTPEHRPPGDAAGPGQGGGRGRGGRGGGGPINFGIDGGGGGNFRSSYVDWQPIQPGTAGPYEPTRHILGPEPPPAPATAKPPRGGGAARGSGGGGGRNRGGSGGGRGGQQTKPTGTGSIPPPGEGGMPRDPAGYFQEVVARLFGGAGPHVGQQARAAVGGGVNVNNLDFMTPGWIRDRSAGTLNTSGFPDATLPGPNPGENIDQYRTRLHDMGYDQATIASVTGPSGFQRSGPNPSGAAGEGGMFTPGDWGWGWGTGPVVRDAAGGYQFANQRPTTGGVSGNRAAQEGRDEFFGGASPGSGGYYV